MPETLTFVTVERPEDYCDPVYDDTDGGPILAGYKADPTRLGGQEWADALDFVLAHGEGEVMCALSSLVDDATGQLCANHVGYYLFEDDDEPWRSGLLWKTTTLVKTAEGIVAVCEDDTPPTLYEAALDAHKRLTGWHVEAPWHLSVGGNNAACGQPGRRFTSKPDMVTCEACQRGR